MDPGKRIVIRKFVGTDKDGVRRIACDTAFLNAGRLNLMGDDEVLADALTRYYTNYEPESCLVAEYKGMIVGYIIGTLDAGLMGTIMFWKVIPFICLRILLRGTLLQPAARKLAANMFQSILKGEFNQPDFSEGYPAMLHINVAEPYRNHGAGKQLITAYLKYLKDSKAEGVHFGTLSEAARGFFEGMGFNVLYKGRRTYLKYATGNESPYYIMGMKIAGYDANEIKHGV